MIWRVYQQNHFPLKKPTDMRVHDPTPRGWRQTLRAFRGQMIPKMISLFEGTLLQVCFGELKE